MRPRKDSVNETKRFVCDQKVISFMPSELNKFYRKK